MPPQAAGPPEPGRPAVPGARRAGRARRAGGRVQGAVTELILRSGLTPGQPLPTEAELMDILGVSRNSVREALKGLQALDIVEIRHGYGTYVGESSLAPLVEQLTFRTLARGGPGTGSAEELHEVLEVLEEGLLARAAPALGPSDLQRLGRLLDRMEEHHGRGEPFAAPETEFRQVLYGPLGDRLAGRLLTAVREVDRRVAAGRPEADGDGPESAEIRIGRYRTLLAALCPGEAATGRPAADAHVPAADAPLPAAEERGDA